MTLYDVRRMDAADEMDEDELLDYDVQMSIQESCQRGQLTGSERYSNMKHLHNAFKCLYFYVI